MEALTLNAVTFVEIGKIEAALVAMVVPLAAPLPVEPFPENPRTYVEETLDSALGVVLVSVASGERETFGEAHSLYATRIQLSVLAPGLRAGSGRDADGAQEVISRLIRGRGDSASGLEGASLVVGDERFDVTVPSWRFVRHYAAGIWHYVVELRLVPAYVSGGAFLTA